MNVLLLGNGFDLNHIFPTSYINFLNTVNFLINSDWKSLNTVGKVFGSTELHEKDYFIKKCYDKHSVIYEHVSLNQKILEQMIESAKSNLWFNYLLNTKAKNINWIDFEKEIVRVIEAFTNFFEECPFMRIKGQVVFDFRQYLSMENKFIIKNFPFFFESIEEKIKTDAEMTKIRDKYVREKIAGSDTLHLCQEEIIEDLYSSLKGLADILKTYLSLFVDSVSQEYKELNIKAKFDSLPSAERVYSFNYTNTYEMLYRPNIVEHIHGNTNTNIVLGVNPDENDEVLEVDTTFLFFKKYFQRTFYSTDNSFLKKIYSNSSGRTLSGTTLYVVGHSLDATDKDVIKLIFESVDKICIFYHSESSVKSQIRNLVEIYGKQGLDILRAEKELCFLEQSDVKWDYSTNN